MTKNWWVICVISFCFIVVFLVGWKAGYNHLWHKLRKSPRQSIIAWHACEVKEGSRHTVFSLNADGKATGVSCSIADDASVVAGTPITISVVRP